MRLRPLHRVAPLLLVALLGANFLTSCGEIGTAPSSGETGCADDAALIRVGDGYLQRLCGCAETDTSIVLAGNAFECTVSAGDTVIFLYIGARVRHRIVSSGTPGFMPSVHYDPDSSTPIATHAVTLEAAGAYLFEDEYFTALSGTITVL